MWMGPKYLLAKTCEFHKTEKYYTKFGKLYQVHFNIFRRCGQFQSKAINFVPELVLGVTKKQDLLEK